MSDLLIPPGAESVEDDYAVVLVAAVRRWSDASVQLIRDRLDMFADSWIGDLIGDLVDTWTTEVPDLARKAQGYMSQASAAHKGWWARLVSKVTGADDESAGAAVKDLWMPQELEGRMRENIRLIKDIGEKAAEDIERVIRDGLRDGITRKQMAGQIQEILSSTEARAVTIARDQVQKHYSAINELRQKDAGIDGYYWDHSRDSVVRKAHRERGGQFFKWSAPPPDGHPGQPVNCRCAARPRLPEKIYDFPVKERYQDAA